MPGLWGGWGLNLFKIVVSREQGTHIFIKIFSIILGTYYMPGIYPFLLPISVARVSPLSKSHMAISFIASRRALLHPSLVFNFPSSVSLSLSTGFFPFAYNCVQELPAWQTDRPTLASFPGLWSCNLARNIVGMIVTTNEPSLGPAPEAPTYGYLQGTQCQPYLQQWALRSQKYRNCR